MLSGTLRTNELVVSDVVDRIVATDAHTVAMLGLSFKTDTDDLRESPNVELAERLLGKGFDVRIHDPVVNPERLVGANLRYIEARLPHLRRLLFGTAAEAMAGADTVVVSASQPAVVAGLLEAAPARIIDLSGDLGPDVEALPGYEGVAWAG
jgi:GDP-mannose 6-dehydrogenase